MEIIVTNNDGKECVFYNASDTMELINIKDVCFHNQCITCPLYDDEESECMLEHCPIKWDLEEIERRFMNYGKKEEK